MKTTSKKTQKISINLTQEQYDIIKALATMERRNISELCALIVVDNSQALFLEHQQRGEMEIARFTLSKFRTVNLEDIKGEEKPCKRD